jgi:hypothetical protein
MGQKIHCAVADVVSQKWSKSFFPKITFACEYYNSIRVELKQD